MAVVKTGNALAFQGSSSFVRRLAEQISGHSSHCFHPYGCHAERNEASAVALRLADFPRGVKSIRPLRCRILRMSSFADRLNGWQRIGVVVSILWAFGGAFWGYNIGYYEGGNIGQDFEQCKVGAQNWYENQYPIAGAPRYTTSDLVRDLGRCEAEYHGANKNATSAGWLYAVLLAVLPIPLAWLAVYKSIALLRWIREGFQT